MNRSFIAIPVLLLVAVFLMQGTKQLVARGIIGAEPAAIGFTPTPLIGLEIPAFEAPALDGGAPLTSAKINLSAPRGNVAIVNFFASWCAPCLIEHPQMLELATRENVALYGIAWRDEPADTAAWLARNGDPYSAVGSDQSGVIRINDRS